MTLMTQPERGVQNCRMMVRPTPCGAPSTMGCLSCEVGRRQISEKDDREAQCCGHQFQTVRQRRQHEAKVARGERVTCPCGDVCSEATRSCPCCGCWNDSDGLCGACWTHQRDGVPCDQRAEV